WPQRPVRVQHRSGAIWALNSKAIEIIGADRLSAEERRTGLVWRDDSRLRILLGSAIGAAAIAAVGVRLAGFGITSVTDATPDLAADGVCLLRDNMPEQVLSMGPAGGPMPRKIVIADHRLPLLDDLLTTIGNSHDAGRAVAIHAVSNVALILAIAALNEAGVH